MKKAGLAVITIGAVAILILWGLLVFWNHRKAETPSFHGPTSEPHANGPTEPPPGTIK